MDLSIYESENARRQDYTKVTDEHLIKWDPADYKSSDATIPEANILTPTTFKTSPNFVEKHAFNRRFQLLSNGLLNYIDWDHVIVGGGAVSNAINKNVEIKTWTPNEEMIDIDLFLYGLTPEAAKTKIAELIEDIQRAANDRGKATFAILKNNYTITLINNSNHKIKFQIILRLYKCIYEVLAGFDVDSCAVAYNGVDVFLTARSLNSFVTGYNVVDMSRRSPSYESRLHKYTRRGFGIYLPFDWSNYNKLYFLNRHTKGLDRLLILQRYNKKTGLQRLLNYVSKRRNIKFGNRPVSDYEGSEELKVGRNLRLDITRFNQRVSEEYRYNFYRSIDEFAPELTATTFMTHNPGQQLTGSFHPITEGDWVSPNYAPFGVDFIGRSSVLMDIKAGKQFELDALYDVKERDNSLFNVLHYLIMYNPDEEFLIQAWDNKSRFHHSDYNLYELDYVQIAMICRRYTLVQHIYSKIQNDTPSNVWSHKYIDLALYLDDLKLLKTIFRYYKNSIYEKRAEVKRYKCSAIAEHFGLELAAKDNSLATTLNNMTNSERINYVLNDTRYVGKDSFGSLLKSDDYQRFTNEELRLYHHRAGESSPLFDLALQDVSRNVEVDETYKYAYPAETFEAWWYSHKLSTLKNAEFGKNKDRAQRALQILYQLFPQKKVEESLKLVFKDPIVELDPVWVTIARKIWQRDFAGLQYVRLWSESAENTFYREVLFAIDDYSVLRQFLEEKYVAGFLGKYLSELGPNLRAEFQTIKAKQVSLNSQLHRDYAEALCNTPAHLQVLESGELSNDGLFVENAFGQTPYDYAIGQLLYYWTNGLGEDPTTLDKLKNLRETTVEIDRTTPLVLCTKEMVTNVELENLVNCI